MDMLKRATMPMSRLYHSRLSLSNGKCRHFSSIRQGSKFSQDFKQYLKLSNGEVGSYFHDVPLELDPKTATVNMVVEIPRWSNAKFEISKELKFNPITQDTKKHKLRFVNNIFPFHGYMHNYGAIPQTWEDPTKEDFKGTGLKGDNDPLDCCEIGSNVAKIGHIKKVKILGSLGLIDDGELDWKVIVIDTKDPLASKLTGLNDVEEFMPGLLHHTREWFRNYKVPQGKPKNDFAFNEEYQDIEKTMSVIEKCNYAWNKLITRQGFDSSANLPSTERAGNNVIIEEFIKSDSVIPSECNKWYYV